VKDRLGLLKIFSCAMDRLSKGRIQFVDHASPSAENKPPLLKKLAIPAVDEESSTHEESEQEDKRTEVQQGSGQSEIKDKKRFSLVRGLNSISISQDFGPINQQQQNSPSSPTINVNVVPYGGPNGTSPVFLGGSPFANDGGDGISSANSSESVFPLTSRTSMTRKTNMTTISRRRRRQKSMRFQSRESCATMIQSYFRGFLVRQSSSIYNNRLKIYREVVEDMIDDYLTGEFIPNLLIDVLTNTAKEYDPVSPEEQANYAELEKILVKVVNEEVEAVVRTTVREFLVDFLEFRGSKSGRDPTQMVAAGLIDDILKKMVGEIVKESLQDMVDEFLFMQQFHMIMDDFVGPIIEDLAKEALQEASEDEIAEEMIEVVLRTLNKSVAELTIQETQDMVESRRRCQDFDLVALLSREIMERRLQEFFLKSMGSRGENVLFREQTDILLRKRIAQRLWKVVVREWTPLQDLEDNFAARASLEILFEDAVFCDEMKERFLDELS